MALLPISQSGYTTKAITEIIQWTSKPPSKLDTEYFLTGLANSTTESSIGTNDVQVFNACSVVADYEALRKAGRYLWLVFGTLLIVCGTVGNCFTLVVLHSKHFKIWARSTVFVLSALAVVDTMMLLLSLEDWVRAYTKGEVNLSTMSSVICRTRMYIAAAITNVSSWTMVIITVQRAILVCFPAQAKKICTLTNTVIGWVGVTIFWMFVNAHYFWTSLLFKAESRICQNGNWTPSEVAYCKPKNDNMLGISQDMANWFNLATISVIPAAIICLSNASIIWTVTRQSAKSNRKEHALRNSMSRMLVILSTMFLLTTLPWAIFSIRNINWFKTEIQPTPRDLAHFDLASDIVTLIFGVNNASNFFLYVLSGPSFRTAFVSLVCTRTKNRETTLHRTGNNKFNLTVQNSRGC